MGGSEKPEMFRRSCRPRKAKIRTYQLDEDTALIYKKIIIYNTTPSKLFIFDGVQFFVDFSSNSTDLCGLISREIHVLVIKKLPALSFCTK